MHSLRKAFSAFVLLLASAAATAAPSTPVPLFPIDGEDVIDGDKVVYRWAPETTATRYDFLLYDRVTGTIVHRDVSVDTGVCTLTECRYTAPIQLPRSSAHVWRVAALDSTGKSPFSRATFDLVAAAIPSVPEPIAPVAGASLNDGDAIVLSWRRDADALEYDLLVYDRTAGAIVFRDRRIDADSCGEQNCVVPLANDINLPMADNHVWRVAARNGAGMSAFSRATFDIIPNSAPATPIPLSPLEGERVASGASIGYEWEPSPGASIYDLYVYDRTLRRIVHRDRTIPAASCEPSVCRVVVDGAILPFAERHAWRVAAVNAAGKSAFAGARFDVGTEPGAPGLPDLSAYDLVFSDDFDGTSLDASKWHTGLLWGPYLPINNEQQLYVDTLGMHTSLAGSPADPFEVSGGTLKIRATATTPSLQPPPRPPEGDPSYTREFSTYRYNGAVGTPGDANYRPGYDPNDVDYLSGVITSYESFKTTHGYVEARLKLPAGRGLWPAFWMLPTHYVQDVPEIDVMEFLGQDVDRVYHTYHYFDVADDWQLISTPSFPSFATDWTADFHTFGMSWSPRKIIWYIDGVKVKEINDSEYLIPNQAMYLLANLAVGGNWPGPPDASTLFPATYEIDYVRAYKKRQSASLNLAEDFQIVFQDEFNGSSLDASKWNTHFLWGPYLPINDEEQYYVDALGSDSDIGYTPFEVSDGNLSITARAANDPAGVAPHAELPGLNDSIWSDYSTFRRNTDYVPQDFTSGMITSYDAFKFANGYAEIRTKLPAGKGLWPAFWLLNGYYVAQSPEIDVLETRGENPREITHAYHRYAPGGILNSTVQETVGGDATLGYSDDFHTFGVRWRPGKIEWYIDRQKVKEYVGDDVAYQVMYVIANLAVGGSFPAVPDDPTAFPVSYVIDYIRVYQEKDPA